MKTPDVNPTVDGRLQPLDQLTAETAGALKLLVSDIDGTLTTGGRFPEDLFSLFRRVRETGLNMVLATGRSSGMAASFAATFPSIEGAISENGAVYFAADGSEPRFLVPELGEDDFRKRLDLAWEAIAKRFSIRVTEDSGYRLAEKSFVKEKSFSASDLAEMRTIAQGFGLESTYSTIHVHIIHPKVDKGRMIATLAKDWGIDPKSQTITVGDSPNDRAMFRQTRFDTSVGTAGILDFVDEMGSDLPAFVAPSVESDGFREVVETLEKLRGKETS